MALWRRMRSSLLLLRCRRDLFEKYTPLFHGIVAPLFSPHA